MYRKSADSISLSSGSDQRKGTKVVARRVLAKDELSDYERY